MAKIEQDNRILAELDHSRSTTLGELALVGAYFHPYFMLHQPRSMYEHVAGFFVALVDFVFDLLNGVIVGGIWAVLFAVKAATGRKTRLCEIMGEHCCEL